jgi:cation:H+ antiporter
MFVSNLIIYILAFIAIWYGAGLIVTAASKFSTKLRLSPFAFSFVFLGILTSTPEFSVGLQAVADHDAEIFVGNLLGGIVVLFLVVIPVLAVFGKGISLKHELGNKTLIGTIGVILLPALFTLDKRVTNLEGVIMIISYIALLYAVQRKNGIFDRKNDQLLNIKAYSYVDFLKIIAGLGIVFVSSSLIVDKTMYFADFFNISAFYIGLIIVALGTDLPELTLAVRSVLSGKKELAMGDYVGAAAVSTLLFGIFTLLHNGEVITVSNFFVTFIFIATALGSFYFFSKTKGFITRNNGIALLVLYVFFLIFELAH